MLAATDKTGLARHLLLVFLGILSRCWSLTAMPCSPNTFPLARLQDCLPSLSGFHGRFDLGGVRYACLQIFIPLLLR